VWRDGDPQPVVMQGRLRSVTGVALSRDGATIAASGGDGSTGLGFSRVWESASGRILRSDGPNAPYTGLVTAIAFSPDGADVYTASYDNTVSRIPVAGGRPAKVIDTLGTALTSVSIEGNRIATGAIDGSAAVWDLDGGRIVDLRGHRGSVTAIAFVPHSPMVITAGEDGQVLGWDWRSADPPHLAADDIGTARVTSSPASVEYVTYSGGVGRWNSGNGVRTPAVEPPVAANWFALNGRGDIARENPGGVITIARGDGTRMPDIRGVPADTYELALSENGRWLAVSDTRGDLLEWDLSGRTAGQILAARADANADLAVSESGAVAARIGRRVTLWEEPGGSARTFTAADQPVRALAFTPDGRFLATGADDGTVRVWPVGGGESVALLRHGAGVRGLEFSPDGRLLAAAASDQAVVWDWRRGIADVRWPDPGVNEVHFDSAGERILTVAQVGLRLWTCDVCGPVQKVLETADGRVTRTLTDAERREFAPGS